MSLVKEVNEKIWSLWGESCQELKTVCNPLLIPLLYPEFESREYGGLLFVSLNPSFVPEAYDHIVTNLGFKADEFFRLDAHNTPNDIGKIVQIEAQLRKKYDKFFKKFEEITESVMKDGKANYAHVDLFFVRMTKQMNFKDTILENDLLNEFVQIQLNLSQKLMDSLNPQMIFVANKTASDIFRRKFSATWNEELGCHTAIISGKLTPVFLSGMISSGHPIDCYSQQRLVWHLRKTMSRLRNT